MAAIYRVPCMVTAQVTLTDAGQARVEEYTREIVSGGLDTEEEARHKVLIGIVEWMGVRGRRASSLDGYADLDDDDIKVGNDDWQPSYVEDVEVVT